MIFAATGLALAMSADAGIRDNLLLDSGVVLKPVQDIVFEVCGANGKYVPSESRLENGMVIVSSQSVPESQMVRYGWYKWFTPILYNEESLPASAFRRDSFPAESEGRYYLD